MTTLNYKKSYIACSADTILQTKGSAVYDVYVTGSAVLSENGAPLQSTRGDIIRLDIVEISTIPVTRLKKFVMEPSFFV